MFGAYSEFYYLFNVHTILFSVYFKEIQLLHDVNSTLNHRYEIKANYDALKTELRTLNDAEKERKQRYDHDKHKELIDIEHAGQKLFKEHAKLIHQIEHINWHLSHAHPHEIATPIGLPHLPLKIFHTDGIISGHGHGHTHGKLHCRTSNRSNPNMVSSPFKQPKIRLTKILIRLNFVVVQGIPPNECRTINKNNHRIASQNLPNETKPRSRDQGRKFLEI